MVSDSYIGRPLNFPYDPDTLRQYFCSCPHGYFCNCLAGIEFCKLFGTEMSGPDKVIAACPVCDSRLKEPAGAVGEKTRCAKCQSVVAITAEMVSKAAKKLTNNRAIAALNHPRVVQIYDDGRDREGPFLIPEYVDGNSLPEKGGCPLNS